MLPLRRQDNGKESPFTDEPQYPLISLPKHIFLIFLFCKEVVFGRIWQLSARAQQRFVDVQPSPTC